MYKSNINLNLYKTFYEVAKYGSISEAAKKTFSSQPAISKSIKKLEDELGVQLFFRNLSGVELTEKGKELLFYVEKSYNNLIIAERNMLETENLNRGKLSIGMPSNIGSFYLFDKIISFHKKYPNIEIFIMTGGTNTLINLLESHKVDFVLDTSPIKLRNSNLIKKKLTTVNYCFIINKNSSLKNKGEIKSLKDLSDLPLILPLPNTANRNDLDSLLFNHKIDINNVLNLHTSEMIISAVKRDLGVGYVIENLVDKEIENDELEIINVKEKLPTVDIEFIYEPNYLTTAPSTFIREWIDNITI